MKKIYTTTKDNIIQQNVDSIDIFDPEKSVLYTLNDTARIIFIRLKSNSSVDEIIRYIVQEYNVDLQTAKKDVYQILDELEKNHLIKPSD